MDNQSNTHEGLRELALFAGAGGGILGGTLLGWRTVCAVEIEPYAAAVLCARQNDGILPPFPIWDDVCSFDGKPWRGIVDVISGGFPCQDISIAGKGAGINGSRSGLWSEMRRIIGEVRPRFVFVENSPMLTVRGGTRVIGDLTEMGYDCRWGIVSAADAGAPHKRDRIWIYASDSGEERRNDRSDNREEGHILQNQDGISPEDKSERHRRERGSCETCQDVANSDAARELQQEGGFCEKRRRVGNSREEVANPNSQHEKGHKSGVSHTEEWAKQGERPVGSCGLESNIDRRGSHNGSREWWGVEPDVGRVADGVAARVERLAALGNGQVPQAMALAWKTLGGRIR